MTKCDSLCWDTALGHHTLVAECLEPNGDMGQQPATPADIIAALQANPEARREVLEHVTLGEQCDECGARWMADIQLDKLAEFADPAIARFRERAEQAEARVREGRQLLRRLVKYAREDCAVTPGKTRLARLTDQVADYLNRTHDPKDILR